MFWWKKQDIVKLSGNGFSGREKFRACWRKRYFVIAVGDGYVGISSHSASIKAVCPLLCFSTGPSVGVRETSSLVELFSEN